MLVDYLALIFYLVSLLLLVELAVRSENYLRVLVFVVLFYSVAPLFPFDEFRFFEVEVNYGYRWDVLILYGLFNYIAFVAFSLLGKIKLSRFEDGSSVRAMSLLWYPFVIAFVVEVYFNWQILLTLSKAERIAAPELQTKNMLFFTVPAVEVLVGYWLYDIKNRMFSLPRYAFGLLALVYSVTVGVRHVLFATVVILAVPYLNGRIKFVLLLLIVTFFGEVTNIVKIFFILYSQEGFDVALIYIFEQVAHGFGGAFGVSGEQKAILSNVIIKLDNNLLEYSASSLFYLMPLGAQLSSLLGGIYYEGAALLGDYVGVGVGQGTAYSAHIVLLESPIAIFILMAGVVLAAKKFYDSQFCVLIVSVVYVISRTDISYSAYFFWKTLMVMFFVALLAKCIVQLRQVYESASYR